MFKFYMFNCILETSSAHVTFHALEASRIQRCRISYLLVKTYFYSMYMSALYKGDNPSSQFRMFYIEV